MGLGFVGGDMWVVIWCGDGVICVVIWCGDGVI